MVIREQILERGVSDRGVFRQHYDTDALDASVLLMPLVHFLPATDDRIRKTVQTIADRVREQTGQTIELSRKVDSGILGGIVLRVGDFILDASIRNRLNQLRKELAHA